MFCACHYSHLKSYNVDWPPPPYTLFTALDSPRLSTPTSPTISFFKKKQPKITHYCAMTEKYRVIQMKPLCIRFLFLPCWNYYEMNCYFDAVMASNILIRTFYEVCVYIFNLINMTSVLFYITYSYNMHKKREIDENIFFCCYSVVVGWKLYII